MRKDRPAYLADQVSHSRSGFDPSTFNAVKAGTLSKRAYGRCRETAVRLPARGMWRTCGSVEDGSYRKATGANKQDNLKTR